MFKQDKPLKDRKELAEKARKKYPNRIPVICEKHPDSSLPEIDKKKYLVPKDMTISTFIYVLRKRINKLDKEQAIYLFVNNTLPQVSKNISDIYYEHADEDGFLYMMYSAESTFGHIDHVDEQEELDELLAQGPVLIDFYAKWCGPCKTLGRELPKLQDEFKNVKFVKINIDDADSDLVNSYKVKSIPLVIIHNGGAKPVRIEGNDIEKIRKELNVMK